MGARRLYFLAGVFWALLLGPLVTISVAGFGAGLAWLYVFGDSPWPAATGHIVILLGLGCGLLVAAAAIWIGHDLGRRVAGSSNPVVERRRATVLLFIPLFLAVLTASYLWNEAARFREEMEIAALREADFAKLVGDNQKIDDVSIAFDADESIRAMIRMSGSRAGDYQVSWKIRDSGFSRVLLWGGRYLTLRPGINEMQISFTLEQLMDQYRSVVLHGDGGVLIDEPFRLEVLQEPVLTQREHAELPPGERARLTADESPLRSIASVSFPVRFTISP